MACRYTGCLKGICKNYNLRNCKEQFHRLNFDPDRKDEVGATARKYILKLITLRNFVAKCCKIRKILPGKFCICLYYVREKIPLSRQFRLCNVVTFSARNTNIYTEFPNFARLYIRYFTTCCSHVSVTIRFRRKILRLMYLYTINFVHRFMFTLLSQDLNVFAS